MSISPLRAAKALGHFSGWSLSNIQMQKMLYFAHMFSLGRSRKALIDEEFEAWNLGPVSPTLYQAIKFFGSDKVVDVFPGDTNFPDRKEFEIIKEVCANFKDSPPYQLVRITHHKDGAWAKNYNPNIRGIKIPNADIVDEYNKLYAE